MSNQIKSENKKALKTFIPILILSMFLGGIAGGTLSFFGEEVIKGKITLWLATFFRLYAPYCMIFLSVLLLGVGIIILVRCKEQAKKAEEIEDEEGLEEAEHKASITLLLTSITLIVNFFFFPVVVRYAESNREQILGIVTFVVSMAVLVVLQQKTIDFEKQLNPEKKGSVYDTNFAKKWEDSCDEAQRLMIYKSAYVSYQVTTKAIIGIWLVLMMGMMFFGTGILPIAVLIIVWLVQTVSYCVAAMKLEKRK